MKKNYNHLAKLLVGILIIALIKLAIEKIIQYFTFPSAIIIAVTMVTWGFLAFASFLFIRNWLVAYRESIQSSHDPYQFLLAKHGDNESHVENITRDFRGFYWQLHINIPGEKALEEHHNRKEKAGEIKIKNIEGPYCPKDGCRMDQEKTYFGKHRFRCHHCHYQKKKTENSDTMMHDLREIVDLKEVKES